MLQLFNTISTNDFYSLSSCVKGGVGGGRVLLMVRLHSNNYLKVPGANEDTLQSLFYLFF